MHHVDGHGKLIISEGEAFEHHLHCRLIGNFHIPTFHYITHPQHTKTANFHLINNIFIESRIHF